LWRALSYRWHRNRAEISAIRRYVRRGDHVVDIGCHKGGFLYWLRRYAGATGHVYAFEPQQGLARYLQRTIRNQRWTNVTLEPVAVSSEPGSMDLLVPAAEGHSSPGASLSPASVTGSHYRRSVSVVTLDDYFADGQRIACIKCDCEGHELEVFQGAEQILRRDHPVLLFECEARHMSGRQPADVFTYLQSLGYRGSFFSPAGVQPIERFALSVHQPVREGRFWQAPDYCNNFLFVADIGSPADAGRQDGARSAPHR
jgi:FkbM family methyltransferase